MSELEVGCHKKRLKLGHIGFAILDYDIKRYERGRRQPQRCVTGQGECISGWSLEVNHWTVRSAFVRCVHSLLSYQHNNPIRYFKIVSQLFKEQK
ncbi:hypothetical protein NQ318_017989 [Aromia moschata]|uniref:Uncharacterized protein n=1 Tax=Aromia moschata TaxID=1265417 RepID=A0AAV8YBI3_9CUCU|nr:hypothetical protein NQ318_017989 [Aromia moschata]